MAGDDLHENLCAAFPGAVAAECDGHGWVTVTYPVDDERATADGRVGRCPRCERQKIWAEVAKFIPPRFRQPIDVGEPVMEWANLGRQAQGLYLAGPVGTGKTHAAWMAVATWCSAAGVVPRDGYYSEQYQGGGWHGSTVIFTRMTDLLDDLRPGEAAVQRVRDCQNAKLLILDDLGAEKASEWTQERLYSVIDHRYVNCLPLLVTGNLPPVKLGEQTGDRVASRLAEMCTVVPMTGADRRRAA